MKPCILNTLYGLIQQSNINTQEIRANAQETQALQASLRKLIALNTATTYAPEFVLDTLDPQVVILVVPALSSLAILYANAGSDNGINMVPYLLSGDNIVDYQTGQTILGSLVQTSLTTYDFTINDFSTFQITPGTYSVSGPSDDILTQVYKQYLQSPGTTDVSYLISSTQSVDNGNVQLIIYGTPSA